MAEFDYTPAACKKMHRLVVVRKNLRVRDRPWRMFDDSYFFYITNEWESSAVEIVFSANDRCHQENSHAQPKGGVRALHAPVEKAWYALLLPDGRGSHAAAWREQKRTVLRMEFRTFGNYFLRTACQIVTTGRRTVYRLLGWNRWQKVFFRLLDQLRHPLRC